MNKRQGSVEKIDTIVERIIKNWKILDKREEKIRNKLETILGENLSCDISIQKSKGNILTLLTQSSTLYHELSIYRKNEIQESLRKDGVKKVFIKLVTEKT